MPRCDLDHRNWQYRNWRWGLLFGIGIVLTPLPALANSWTPLVTTALTHLFVANLIIGLVEGLLLARWFRLPRFKTVSALVLANYFSAWGGMVIAYKFLPPSFITIENVHIWIWASGVFLFLVTLVIEYPFFRFSLRKQSDPNRKTLKSLLVIHCISYPLVAVWYIVNSQTSMLTQLEYVPATALELPGQYQLYFKSPDGLQTMRSDLTGENVTSISNSEFQSQLSAAAEVDPDRYERRVHHSRSFIYEPVLKLAEDSDWDFYIRMMVGLGIAGVQDRELGQIEFEFTLELPYMHWTIRYGTHLPGDFIVFQLGRDQICILYPHDRLISLVTRGMEPLVVAAGDGS